MSKRTVFLWRFACVLAVIGSLGWKLPEVLRHQAGIVAIEAGPALEFRASAEAESLDIEPLVEAALFGRAVDVTRSPGEAASDRPALVLRGIFAASQGASTALIDVDQTPGLFRAGAEVTPSLMVTKVAETHVVLEDPDGTLTLYFDDSVVVSARAEEAAEAPSLVAQMSQGLVVPTLYQHPDAPETTAEYIDYWRHRIKKNPRAVLDEIGLRATDAGYVIDNNHDIGVRLAGLRSGDLVRSVNGKSVGDPNADSRLYDDIAASGHARIEVERGGQLLSFSFPLR